MTVLLIDGVAMGGMCSVLSMVKVQISRNSCKANCVMQKLGGCTGDCSGMGGNGTVVSWKGVINGVEVFQPKGLKNPGVHTGPGLSFTVRKFCGEVSLGSFGLGYLSRGMSVFFGFPLLFSEFSTHFGEVI